MWSVQRVSSTSISVAVAATVRAVACTRRLVVGARLQLGRELARAALDHGRRRPARACAAAPPRPRCARASRRSPGRAPRAPAPSPPSAATRPTWRGRARRVDRSRSASRRKRSARSRSPASCGRQAGGRLGQLAAADVEPGVALVGRLRGGDPCRRPPPRAARPPARARPRARSRRRDRARPPRVRSRPGAPRRPRDRARGGRPRRLGRAGLAGAQAGERGLCIAVCAAGRARPRPPARSAAATAAPRAAASRGVLGGQPVALGPRRHPGRLAGVAGAPELAAVGVDALAGAGHRDAVVDLGQVVDEPHALEQPSGDRVAHGDDLDQRPGAGGGRQRRRRRAGVGQDHRDLSPGLGQHRQGVGQALGHDGAGPPAQAGRHRPLVSRAGPRRPPPRASRPRP